MCRGRLTKETGAGQDKNDGDGDPLEGETELRGGKTEAAVVG